MKKKEKARCDEMEQQLDKRALNELMEAAMKDGEITFNTKHSIIITKEERKQYTRRSINIFYT